MNVISLILIFKALNFLCVVGVAMCDCVIHDIINGGDPRRAWGG